MELGFNISDIILFVGPYIVKKLPKLIRAHGQDKEKVSGAIQDHLIEVSNWASVVQFFGMGTPQPTEEATVALDIYAEPRRFQSAGGQGTMKHEKDLLLHPHHVLLLGEAGSGKTTTLKRITLTVLKEEPIDETDILQYPMVIRLRELYEGQSLFSRIAELFGLSIKSQEIIENERGRDSRGKPIEVETKRTEMRIGNEKVESVIPKFLNETNTLLLLDGLDELKAAHKAKIRNEIVTLGRWLTTSKIILSCRSGDYVEQMDGFAVFEICPLDKKKMLSINEKWLGPDNTEFVKCLQKVPYFDVGDRPLLLTQLLFIYKRYGYLPEQPTQIYAKLINLLLEEWDAERGVKRDSKYAGFTPAKKAEFLAALAYLLTYSLDKTMFKEDDLVKAYVLICDRFKLPRNEATQVAHEIQTHTGIVVLGPKDIYEFCHLSLQEYLAAEYIVKSPLDQNITRYLSKYSAPLAIAVALSSHPSNWFANLILGFGNLKDFDDASMASFLSRMLIEYPSFEVFEPLGFTMLALFTRYSNSTIVCSYLDKLLETSGVIESVAKALKWYVVKRRGQIAAPFIEVSLTQGLEGVYKFQIPLKGMFPRRILPKLRELSGKNLFAQG
jgi:hypothetical protein